MADDRRFLEAALRESEGLALKNNYLGANFDFDDVNDPSEARSAAVDIAERARRSKDVLSTSIDFRSLKLKIGHESRPLWVVPNGHVYLETSNKYFNLATDFLVAISEPESRPELIHHYKLTPYSLYAAVSVNLDTDTILGTLERFSKVPIPHEVKTFILKSTESQGKAKLVLKRNRLFVESRYPSMLKQLLREKAINEAKDDSVSAKLSILQSEAQGLHPSEVKHDQGLGQTEPRFIESAAASESAAALATNFEDLEELDLVAQRVQGVQNALEGEDDDDEDGHTELSQQNESNKIKSEPGSNVMGNGDLKRGRGEISGNINRHATGTAQPDKVVSFEIRPECIEQVKEAAMNVDCPLMEEYDFRRDDRNPNLPINLQGSTKVRPYQAKSLAKMFGNGRARSGIIVLPCGAGKTLTGITAMSTIKKSCIIFCINAVGVEQWIRSIRAFTTLPSDHIRRFTSGSKDNLHPSGATVLVTTYNMMSYSKSRSEAGEEVMEQVRKTDWGLIIMDEVHVVPAKMFRMALRHAKSHCKLGLTATLVREDNLIDDLNFLIGPKLYEANWLKLTDEGYLAKVLCAEVWCPMAGDFFEKYLRCTDSKIKQLLYVMNPNKFSICEMLMIYHRQKGDKVLIFSDNIPAIKRYSVLLGVHNMYGSTSQWEREKLLRKFRGGPSVKPEEEINVLIISQVGDVGIDLPQANVIIQISSHFGSRRQEAQRLGRILRPKAGTSFNVGWNAFFYTLISMDTSEMYFSHKRQKYLVDQGYTFKVIRNIKQVAEESGIPYQELAKDTQREILENLDAENVTSIFSKATERKGSSRSTALPSGEKQKKLTKGMQAFIRSQRRNR